MARHAAPSNHRRRYIASTAIVAAAALAAVLLITVPGGSKPAAQTSSTATTPASPAPTCPHQVSLRVVAASGIAPAVRSVARTACVRATVTVDDSAAAASELGRGEADVWIPDSRSRAILAGKVLAASAPSVAVSPIVVAASKQADTARFSKTPLSWTALLSQSSLSPLHVEIQSSKTSSATLVVGSALNAVAAKSTGDKYLGLASAAVASATMKSAGSDAIGPQELRVEEARLVKDQPDAKILTLTGGYPQLDYPWLTAPRADAATKTAAAKLLRAVQGPAGDAARQQQGLLDPGALAVNPGALAGTPAGVLLPAPSIDEIPTLYALADAGAQHGNILGVLDVSGSMNYPTGPGQPSEMAAVQDSGKLALPLLSDQTRMGLWEFSYQLDPPRDYLQILPMAPLSSSRDRLLQALAAATPRPTGGTSLYATVLDAYKYVQANWQAGYANSVLVFTDGRDEDDPGAPSLASLQTQLKATQDPAKPIQLIMLGYGDADIQAMTAITDTVGGSVYHINTKVQIVGAFIDAISRSVLNSLTHT